MNFSTKSEMLAYLWLEYKEDETFKPFIDYNDIGLPLAYCFTNGRINELSALGEESIQETVDMFFKLLKITEEEVDSLEDQSLASILKFAYNRKVSNEAPKITYTEIPIEYTDEGEEITVVVTCEKCGNRTYDKYPDICPKCLYEFRDDFKP